MLNIRVSLRKVATIAACLAVTTVFASCEKEEEDPIDTGTEQDANIVAFTFEGIVGKADIKKEDFTVTAQAAETVELSEIVADFTLSTGATAKVGNVAQVSKQTANNFTNPVIYKVTSGDGETTNDWTVTITGGKTSGGDPGEKKHITYNNPVTAYYIEYTEDDESKFEAYENKEYCYTFGNTYQYIGSEEIVYTWAGDNHWYKHTGDPVYEGSWLSEKYKEYEYPLGNFAAYVSNYKGTNTFYKYGLSLADVAASDDLEMPNNTDVTALYIRSEKIMDIMCDVFKDTQTASGGTETWTWWVDPETGFTLKYERIDRHGDTESYEVTKLETKPDWDGKHLRPKASDTIENVD